MRFNKVLDLRQVHATRGPSLLLQPETKKKKKPISEEEREEEEMPENGYDVAALFDAECRQGEREVEDEPVEESLHDLLFFDFECRQENGNHEPNLCVVQDEASKEWVFKGDKTRDEFCEWLFAGVYGHGSQLSRLRQLFHSAICTQTGR